MSDVTSVTMTGDEHYVEAERLLRAHDDGLKLLTPETLGKMTPDEVAIPVAIMAAGVAAAQAHATLALAYVTGSR